MPIARYDTEECVSRNIPRHGPADGPVIATPRDDLARRTEWVPGPRRPGDPPREDPASRPTEVVPRHRDGRSPPPALPAPIVGRDTRRADFEAVVLLLLAWIGAAVTGLLAMGATALAVLVLA